MGKARGFDPRIPGSNPGGASNLNIRNRSMKELLITQHPCVICPITGKWKLTDTCELCNYYKGVKDTQDNDVVICIANERKEL